MRQVTKSIIKYRFLHNQDRRFGSSLGYVPALIENENGFLAPALFTAEQIKDAMERARTNPEDAPKPTWFRQLISRIKS